MVPARVHTQEYDPPSRWNLHQQRDDMRRGWMRVQSPEHARRGAASVLALQRGNEAKAAYTEDWAGQQVQGLFEVNDEFHAGECKL
jgi:hypothetical protein